jgi:hypothetical protein
MGFTGAGLLYAIAAATTTAAGVYQGQQQARAQKTGLNLQRTAQQQAETVALRQRKDAEAAQAAANRRAPDLAEIMAGESELARLSASSTNLTGGKAPTPPRPPNTQLGY